MLDSITPPTDRPSPSHYLLGGNFSYPNLIWSGAGQVDRLLDALQECTITHPLLITDRQLNQHAIGERVKKILQHNHIPHGIYSDIGGNPTETDIHNGIEFFKKGKYDGMILLGGGSAMDAGKIIAFMAEQTRPIWDFEDIPDWWRRASHKNIVPMIAIPTTAGTGSEVGRAGVVIKESSREKKIIFHPHMLPKLVIQDPTLTLSLPPALTMATAMDALTHCIEAFICRHFHPLSDQMALGGMVLIKNHLPLVIKNPNDITARHYLMVAAMMGGLAFQKGLGAVHALSHIIGGFYHTHHGLTNGVLLPFVVDYHQDDVGDKYQIMAHHLDLPDKTAKGFITWLKNFTQEMGVPKNLRGLAPIEPEKFALLAQYAVHDPSNGGCPRPLEQENYIALLNMSY